MGPARIIFQQNLLPLRRLGQAIAALIPLYREVIFLLISFVFAVSIVAVTGMNRIHSRYHYAIHKGIWEDIMISGIRPNGIPKAPATLSGKRDGVEAREDPLPSAVNTVVQKVQTVTEGCTSMLAVYQALEAKVDVIGVLFQGHDVSRIHGQMDVWIKAYAPQSEVPAALKNIPEGYVVISSSLAHKFSQDVVRYPREVKIRLGVWDTRLEKTFQLNGVHKSAGRMNVIYMNANDLREFGFQNTPYTVGMELFSADPKEIEHSLMAREIPEGSQIISAADYQRPSSLLFFLRLTPLLLISLFFLILLVLYHFTCLYTYEKRARELALLRLYAYAKWKRLLLFFFLNISPALVGFSLALLLLLFDWPVSFVGLFSHVNIQVPLTVSQYELVFNWIPMTVLLGTIVVLFLMTTLFILRHHRIDGS